MNSIVSLLRPKQWLKNLFVFMPAFFSGMLSDPFCLINSIIGFGIFCLASSSIYCLNDSVDKETDRLHPSKRSRPVASGKVSQSTALVLMVVLILCSAGLCFLFGIWSSTLKALGIVAFYFVLNVFYCFILKNIAIVDAMTVAVGFVLRVVLGGVVCDIWLSPWIVVLTFLLALFLSFSKRHSDYVLYQETGVLYKKTLKDYNLSFLNLILGILAAVTIVSYLMYTLSSEVMERMGNLYLFVTSIFVIMAVLRYLQLAIVGKATGSPTNTLLHDVFLQSMIVCWILSYVIIIYI